MIYIHIPFCKTRCSYCAFVSSTGRSAFAGKYVEAVLSELDLRRNELSPAGPRTIYIGGGTPSSLPTDILRKLLEGLAGKIDLSAVEEYTIEVNPDDVTPSLLSMLRDNGINRISMGVQSFNDRDLRNINRRHDAVKALEAISMLKSGDWNFSIDLIYGLPEQGVEDWSENLTTLFAINPPHFSAYLLSYEPGTPLALMADRGEVNEAGEELVRLMYDTLCQKAADYGYRHYEISNFAIPGKEAIHNSRYWQNCNYLGLGTGASSFNNNIRSYVPEGIESYIKALDCGKLRLQSETESGSDIVNTRIFISLRTADGLDLETLSDDSRAAVLSGARPMIESGLLSVSGNRLSIPEKEWLRSDYIIRELMI